MRKWSVHFEVYASTAIEVEAETEEEASDKAWDTVQSPSICYHCARKIDIGGIGESVDIYEIVED